MKLRGLTDSIAPYLDRLGKTGTWMVGETRQRILKLAGEADPEAERPESNYSFSTVHVSLRGRFPRSNLQFEVICLSKRGLPRRRKSIGGSQ